MGGGEARRRAAAILAALTYAILVAAPVSGTPPAPRACERYANTPTVVGRVTESLHELSGLAASRRHAGIYWAHNDSGNSFTAYAVRENGSLVAVFPLRGATPVDIEDAAVGPCARGTAESCLYLADVGDNTGTHAKARIFKVREPESLRPQPLAVEVVSFTYPDGPHNVEAVLVDPRTAEVFLVSKTLLSLGEVYRVDGAEAVHVRTVRAPPELDAFTTGASAHPGGERLLLRTYTGVWELRRPGARTLAEVFDAEPQRVPSAAQRQGEAVTYTHDGRGYLLGGEGTGSPLLAVRCADR